MSTGCGKGSSLPLLLDHMLAKLTELAYITASLQNAVVSIHTAINTRLSSLRRVNLCRVVYKIFLISN